MPKIVPIVEGEGEVSAIPKLLFKILYAMERYDILVGDPINASGCDNLKKSGGLETYVKYAWLQKDCSGILVLMDADEDCAKTLAEGFSVRIRKMGAKHPVVSVIANYEYETWLLASVESIAGHDFEGKPGLPAGLQSPENVETLSGIKGWFTARFPKGRPYKETEDQPAMTRLIDIEIVRQRSRSFRRLCHAVEQIVEAIDNGQMIVTP
jgi:hypothetical protein